MIGMVAILAFIAIFLFGWGVSLFIRSRKLEEENVVSRRLKGLKKKLNTQTMFSAKSLSAHHTQEAGFLGRLIQGSGLKIGPAKLFSFSLLLGVGFFFLPLLITKKVLLGMALGGFGAFLPFLYLMQVRKKRLATFERQFPDAVALMASCLKAGHGLTAAINAVATEMSAPICEEFAQVMGEMNLGVTARDAFVHMEDRIGSRDLRFFTAAVLLQKEVGGSLAEVFTNLEETVRERFELKGELKAMTAQQRLTGWILGLMPIGMGLIIYMMNPSYFLILFEDPWGHFLIAGGIILQILGFFAIKKVVAIEFE